MFRRSYLVPFSSHPTELPKSRMESAFEWISNRNELPNFVRSRARRRYFHINGIRHTRRFRQRDIDENTETRLPPNETVSFRAIWMVEFFGPPDAGGIYKRLQQLDAVSSAWGQRGYAKWLKSTRTANGGAWTRLPDFAAPGQTTLGRDELFTELPEGVRRVTAGLVAVTHGITALVLRFEYEDDFAKSYGELLREDQGKKLEPIGAGRATGQSIISPMFMKSRKVKEWRLCRIKQASSWIAAHYPGHFVRHGETHPVVHFVTTAHLVPWQDDTSGSRGDGYSVLDLRPDFRGHWEPAEMTALRFRWTSEHADYRHGREEVLACAAREEDLLSGEPVGVGPHYSSDISHAMYRMDDELTDIAVRWGLFCYVAKLGNRIAEVRDQATSIASDATHKSFVSLRNRLLVSGIESQLVAKEIVSFCGSDRWIGQGFQLNEVLSQPLLDLGRLPGQFHSSLAAYITNESARISSSEKEVRELVSAAADLTNAAYGIRLQAVVLWLTVVSVVVAIIALVVAFRDGG